MRIAPYLLAGLISIAGAAAGAEPATVYKCTADGKTSYADRPCARGPSLALPPVAGVDAGLGSVRTDDSRALLALEQQRSALQAQREARDARVRREERADLRASRAAGARRKQCQRLRLRVKWAEEDLARGARSGAHADRAALRLRRQRESLAVECPA